MWRVTFAHLFRPKEKNPKNLNIHLAEKKNKLKK